MELRFRYEREITTPLLNNKGYRSHQIERIYAHEHEEKKSTSVELGGFELRPSTLKGYLSIVTTQIQSSIYHSSPVWVKSFVDYDVFSDRDRWILCDQNRSGVKFFKENLS